jgi:hypothetical protein
LPYSLLLNLDVLDRGADVIVPHLEVSRAALLQGVEGLINVPKETEVASCYLGRWGTGIQGLRVFVSHNRPRFQGVFEEVCLFVRIAVDWKPGLCFVWAKLMGRQNAFEIDQVVR